MIGYYVHHVGHGHLDRACAIARHLGAMGEAVTGLSSLPRPSTWPGGWVHLARDDDGVSQDADTAAPALHWAPLRHPGLRDRMATVASWIGEQAPAAFVSDLSVEVTVLARMLGVPVITTVLPGRRDDPAHQLGFQLARAIIAPWPELRADMCVGLERHRSKVVHAGGLSRFDATTPVAVDRGPPRVFFLAGSGGGGYPFPERPVAGWRSSHRGPGRWTDDLWPDLCAATVVVTHAGLGAISDVAAARRPAVVVAQHRPHDEQMHTAAGLAAAGLAVVLDELPTCWNPALERAAAIDTSAWTRWSDGGSAARCAQVIVDVARDNRA